LESSDKIPVERIDVFRRVERIVGLGESRGPRFFREGRNEVKISILGAESSLFKSMPIVHPKRRAGAVKV